MGVVGRVARYSNNGASFRLGLFLATSLRWLGQDLLASTLNRLTMNKLALFGMLLCASAPTLKAQDATAEAALRAIIDEQAAAWNAGDGVAYSRHLAPDASFTNIFGMVMYGKDAFVKRHVQILTTFFKGTTKKHTVRRIRLLTPDVAIVDVENEVHGVKTLPGGVPPPPDGVLRTQLMEVFARRDGRWWVEAYHNVHVKPAAKP